MRTSICLSSKPHMHKMHCTSWGRATTFTQSCAVVDKLSSDFSSNHSAATIIMQLTCNAMHHSKPFHITLKQVGCKQVGFQQVKQVNQVGFKQVARTVGPYIAWEDM